MRSIDYGSKMDIIEEILSTRDIEDMETFLNPMSYTFPSVSFSRLEVGVERIEAALEKKEPILVWGDFDADGQTSTVVLVETLRELGGDVEYYVPSRMDSGHGLDADIIKTEVEKRRIQLLITCDCGTNDTEEIRLTRELGIDVIITDHHVQIQPIVLDDHVIVINPDHLGPQSPFYGLCGVGVAYLVCRQLLRNHNKALKANALLDLVAVGTIADMAPHTMLNRALISRGLPLLWTGKRPGFGAILEMEKLKPHGTDSETVSFNIAPLLNAAGRLDTAAIGINLLLETDPKKAEVGALKLKALNDERKFELHKLIQEIEENLSTEDKNKNVLILWGENWHPGIIGLGANKLADLYGKPVMLIAVNKERNIARGSCRSSGPEDYSIIELLEAQKRYFKQFGGHHGAGGFMMQPGQLALFKAAMHKHTDLLGLKPNRTLYYDSEVDWNALTLDLRKDGFIETVESLAPFGPGHPKPVFISRNVYITSIKQMSGGIHALYYFSSEEGVVHPVYWWFHTPLEEGKWYDIAYTVGKEFFAGRVQPRITLVGVRETEGESI